MSTYKLSDVTALNGNQDVQINNADSVLGAVPGSLVQIGTEQIVFLDSVDIENSQITLTAPWPYADAVNAKCTIAPITAVSSMLTLMQKVNELVLANQTMQTQLQQFLYQSIATLDEAITLAISGGIKVGAVFETAERVSGTKRGGAKYRLKDAILAESRPAEDLGIYIHVGSSGLYFQAVLTERKVTAELYGAILDGNNDDTNAFFRAATTGMQCEVSNGILSIDSVVFSTKVSIHIKEGAEIRLRPPTNRNDRGIYLNADDSVLVCDGLFNGNDTSRSLVRVEANNCRVILPNTTNVTAEEDATGTVAGLEVQDSFDLFFEIHAENYRNTGKDNDSVPRVVALNGTTTRYHSPRVTGKHIVAGVVIGGSWGHGRIDVIDFEEAEDNGLYHIAGSISVGHMIYRGNEEAVVQKAHLVMDKLEVYGQGNCALSLDKSEYTEINHIHMDAEGEGRMVTMKTRSGNDTAGEVYIRRITGNQIDGNLMGFFYGDIDSITVENWDFDYYHTGETINYSYWMNLLRVKHFNLRNINIRFIDLTNEMGNTPILALPDLVNDGTDERISTIEDVNIYPLLSNRKDIAPFEVRISNAAQRRIRAKGMRWQCLSSGGGPYGREATYAPPNSVNGWGNMWRIGYWHKGDDYSIDNATEGPFRVRMTASGEGAAAAPVAYGYTDDQVREIAINQIEAHQAEPASEPIETTTEPAPES